VTDGADDVVGVGVGLAGFGSCLVSTPGTTLPFTRLRRPVVGDEGADDVVGVGVGLAGFGSCLVSTPGTTLPFTRLRRPVIGDDGAEDDVGGVGPSGPLTSVPGTVVVFSPGISICPGDVLGLSGDPEAGNLLDAGVGVGSVAVNGYFLGFLKF
jgi:hypothetical protein